MSEERPLLTWSVVANVLGGVLILVGALAMLVMAPIMSMMGGMMGMPVGGMMTMMLPLAFVGILSGTVSLVAAYRIHRDPDDARPWGTAALAAGVLSLLSMGGFLLGAAATISGGALALVATSGKSGSQGAPRYPNL